MTMTSNLPSTKPPFDFTSRKAWVIFIGVILAVAIFSGRADDKGTTATTAVRPTMEERIALAKAASAPHSKEDIGLAMWGFYHAKCEKLPPATLALVTQRAEDMGRAKMTELYNAAYWMHEAFGNELFCSMVEPNIRKLNSIVKEHSQ